MKILIVTDAWHPQINGVVRTLENTGRELEKKGHIVKFLTPQNVLFRTFPLPSYPEIKLPWNVWRVPDAFKVYDPDVVHIATEGTLGVAARMYCYKHNIPTTSSYHTKIPEYIQERFSFVPLELGRKYMRWLHKHNEKVLVTTPSMKEELEQWNLHQNLIVWRRGVDLEMFNPKYRNRLGQYDHPVLLYVGRVSVEKNLNAFLSLPTNLGHKVIVGDGPDKSKLLFKHPEVTFTGYKHGHELASIYANADVFVFPSKSDTFGLVMLEAMASGTPVAAYPVTGPKDVIINGVNGFMDENLQLAVEHALNIDRSYVRTHTEVHYSWEQCAATFEKHLIPITQ